VLRKTLGANNIRRGALAPELHADAQLKRETSRRLALGAFEATPASSSANPASMPQVPEQHGWVVGVVPFGADRFAFDFVHARFDAGGGVSAPTDRVGSCWAALLAVVLVQKTPPVWQVWRAWVGRLAVGAGF
jgi:hypothetical protein